MKLTNKTDATYRCGPTWVRPGEIVEVTTPWVAGYLISRGCTVVEDTPEVEAEPMSATPERNVPDDPENMTRSKLHIMRKDELVEYGERIGLTLDMTMKKADMIDYILIEMDD